MDERIKQIADHYGYGKQRIQLTEEVGELMIALSKFDRRDTSDFTSFQYYELRNKICEEIVDVQIMLEQLCFLFDFHPGLMKNFYNAKLDRQIERIEDDELLPCIAAVHRIGGKEYYWRVPEHMEIPNVGEIVNVNAVGQVKPVVVQRIMRVPRIQAQKYKNMVSDNN